MKSEKTTEENTGCIKCRHTTVCMQNELFWYAKSIKSKFELIILFFQVYSSENSDIVALIVSGTVPG